MSEPMSDSNAPQADAQAAPPGTREASAADGGRGAAEGDGVRLDIALERALLRELQATWKQLNATHFREQLRPPAFELDDARTRLGQWHPQSRTITIARGMVLTQPWGVVVEVLKHEMAHQYVHEVLRATDETAHGPAFRDICKRLGIDAAARGLPSVAPRSADEERLVERIARLLALAESPNRNEAEAAAAAAQRLMLKYNIDVARDAKARAYGFRHLGTPKARIFESERRLANVLSKHFFVEVIWVPAYDPRTGKRGSVLEVCGTETNLAMAEYVHTFLTRTADQLWDQHKKATGTRGNRDRLTFLAGVMSGFGDKLAAQTKEHREAGLVWVKDADLGGFLRQRHPYVRNVRHTGHARNAAYEQGQAAGRSIVLRRGIEAHANARGHLLPPASRTR